jgi:SAM-dependent methyltransferase
MKREININLQQFYDKQGELPYKLRKIDELRYKLISKEIKPNSSILDIGCRDGELTFFLPRSCEYVGIDISKTRVMRLKSKGFEVYIV